MDKTTVLIIDDHPLFRQGVADAISIEDDILVIGQAATGDEGLTFIRKNKPHIAIIDVNLPDLNGQQVTKHIIGEKLNTRVILLTAYDDLEQQILGMTSGAAAYCTKDIKSEQLVEVIREVAAGKFIIGNNIFNSEGLQQWIKTRSDRSERSSSDRKDVSNPLSLREMEVLIQVTRGMSNKEIASILSISHQTVKNHVSAILRKLNVEDRTQAAIFALRHGWVRLYYQNPDSQE